MQGLKQDLERDIAAYTCGETPAPHELIGAPHLEEWCCLVRERGREFVLIVSGIVMKHPEIDDGAIVSSGAVVWVDRHFRWIRTHKRLWSLGQQRGEPIPLDGIDL
ncbi:hypothetical protein IVB38_12620 [Bradyrhizobium sp. 38]|uniref:hypothetical protein n=1 Tax=unclassified Bradyrhizobium TaxID=2631580 RepID=UPI001FFB2419|nr:MULTISPECIES: hypothetical protein [unclassified Bradyrhizobium]MCK1336842.1 hypothetical protein [Bradyrhizobium sp. 38]MCK1776862.1 hypothetical protein [Bradyrhizobium sp. 132]